MFQQVIAMIKIALILLLANCPGALPIRIIGGHAIEIEDSPHQASLQMFNEHFCGASILNRNTVVTAAHCVQAYSELILSVRVGSTKANQGGTRIGIKSRHVHPDFNRLPGDYDIAILKLSENLKFSSKIKPIRLQKSNPKDWSRVQVSGWGKTNSSAFSEVLQAADLEIFSHQKCKKIYNSAGYNITGRMICAKGTNAEGNPVDACEGDSGGPLVCMNKGLLCGIVSWGHGCASREFAGVYTSISRLHHWIRKFL